MVTGVEISLLEDAGKAQYEELMDFSDDVVCSGIVYLDVVYAVAVSLNKLVYFTDNIFVATVLLFPAQYCMIFSFIVATVSVACPIDSGSTIIGYSLFAPAWVAVQKSCAPGYFIAHRSHCVQFCRGNFASV